MRRAKAGAVPRGILLASILVTMLAIGQAGALIARAEPPVDPPGEPPAPDVTVVQVSDPGGAVPRGRSIAYTLTVMNDGVTAATAVQVTDQLSTGVTFADATPGCAPAADMVTCTLGDIDAGTNVQAVITVTVDRGFCGAIVNSAEVSASNERDEALDNNISNEVSNIAECDEPMASDLQRPVGPDLQVSKRSDADGILHVGDDFLYTITVRNVGDGVASGVELSDVLPPGALHVGVPPFPTFAGDACTVTSSVPPQGGVPHAEVLCGPLPLGPDESASVTIKAIVTGDACGPITNIVDVEGTNEPAANVRSDNRAEATDEIACVSRIRLRKGGPSFGHVGDRIRYAFTARNVGNLDLSNIHIADPGCDTSPVLLDDGNGDDVLSVDERWRFACDQTITADDGDPVRSRAMVSGDHEGGTVTDSDIHKVDVIHPRIDLESTATPTSGSTGTSVVYTYAVTNTGDTTLFRVSVDDGVGHVGEIARLPAGKTVELIRRITLGLSPLTNASTAEGSDVLGTVVSHTDAATVTVVAGEAAEGSTGGGSPFTGADTGALTGLIVVLAALGSILLLMSRGRSDPSVGPSRAPHDTISAHGE